MTMTFISREKKGKKNQDNRGKSFMAGQVTGKETARDMEHLLKLLHKEWERSGRTKAQVSLKFKDMNEVGSTMCIRDSLYLLPEMFSSYSKLYLFDINYNPDSEFDSDYLLIHCLEDKILHLGLVKAQGKEKDLCHCNSFITTLSLIHI